MKKLLNIVICGMLLSAIEYVILLILFQWSNVKEYAIPFTKFNRAIRDANEISAVRFIFYFTFWVLAIIFLYDKINIKYHVLKLALVNCSLYVIISFVMVLFFPFASEYFTESFFYFLVLATLLSPLILSIIPRLKRIINTI
jgi:hypothetical protein